MIQRTYNKYSVNQLLFANILFRELPEIKWFAVIF